MFKDLSTIHIEIVFLIASVVGVAIGFPDFVWPTMLFGLTLGIHAWVFAAQRNQARRRLFLTQIRRDDLRDNAKDLFIGHMDNMELLAGFVTNTVDGHRDSVVVRDWLIVLIRYVDYLYERLPQDQVDPLFHRFLSLVHPDHLKNAVLDLDTCGDSAPSRQVTDMLRNFVKREKTLSELFSDMTSGSDIKYGSEDR